MPYKDQEQERIASRERVRRYRALHKALQGVTTNNVTPLINPTVNPIKAKLEAAGLQVDGHQVSLAVQPIVNPSVSPIYDWTIHRPGDRVRVWQGDQLVEGVVPDDSSVDTCAGTRLVSRNLEAPAFNPNPKPEPKAKRKKRW